MASKATKATKKARGPSRPAAGQRTSGGARAQASSKAARPRKSATAKKAVKGTGSSGGTSGAGRARQAKGRAPAARAKANRPVAQKASPKSQGGRTGRAAPRRVPARARRGTAAEGRAGSGSQKVAARSRAAKPKPLDAAFLQEQRDLLLAERSTYVEQAEDLKAEAESLVQEMEPGDVQFDEESGEGGTVTVDRERDLALSAQALAAVEEIDRALARIDGGTYGVCESCQSPIPKARLRALPYASLCVACKSGGLSRR